MRADALQVGIVPQGGITGYTDFRFCGNNPISVSGCMVIYAESGYAIISIGFRRRVFRKGMMALVFYDDTFWVERRSKDFICRYASHSYDIVEEAIYKLTSPYFWDSLTENPLLNLTEQQKKLLCNWYDQVEWITDNSAEEYKNILLKNCIYNLYMAIDSEMDSRLYHKLKPISRNRSLIIRFLKLLTQHCHQVREVSFYAEKLCISTTYLYKLTHKRWNLSPKELIDQQVTCEIKKYLSNTELTVKEIASRLNFEDVPYMCRFFRKQTGVSPIEFRDDYR